MRELSLTEIKSVSGGFAPTDVFSHYALPPELGFLTQHSSNAYVAGTTGYVFVDSIAAGMIHQAHGSGNSYGSFDPDTAEAYSPDVVGTDGFYIDHGTAHCPSDVPEFIAGVAVVAGFFSATAGALFAGLSILAPSHDHCTGGNTNPGA